MVALDQFPLSPITEGSSEFGRANQILEQHRVEHALGRAELPRLRQELGNLRDDVVATVDPLCVILPG